MNTQLLPQFSGLTVMKLVNEPDAEAYPDTAQGDEQYEQAYTQAQDAFLTTVDQKIEELQSGNIKLPVTAVQLDNIPSVVVIDGEEDIKEFTFRKFMIEQKIRDFTSQFSSVNELSWDNDVTNFSSEELRTFVDSYEPNSHNWFKRFNWSYNHVPLQHKAEKFALEDMLAERGEAVKYIDVTV